MTDDGGNDWNNRKKVCLSWRGKYHDITNQGHQRFCKMSVRRNKCYLEQNQASLVYYSIVRSPLIKRESKLCYFPKLCSNTNSSKTWHLCTYQLKPRPPPTPGLCGAMWGIFMVFEGMVSPWGWGIS